MLFDVERNIKQTIGVEYEIIAFDNSDGSKGLCEIYNLGIKKAKYPLLCFMHEDVELKTENWGNIVSQAFNDNPKLGLIGIAGSTYKALSPSGWHCNAADVERTNIIQSFKFAEKEKFHHIRNPLKEEFSEVACIDGVWFCTLKSIASEITFDEALFKKFHAYDIDFSLQVGQKYEVNVRYDILLEHFSEGNFNQSWILEIIKLHQKWNKYLPINKTNINGKTTLGIEKRTFKDFIDKALSHRIPKKELFKSLWGKWGVKRFSFMLFLKLNRYLISRKHLL